MRDYVSGEGLSEEENELNMTFVVDADPLSYEAAEKDSKWRLAMDAEIKAIEKNETWSLTELLVGAKKIGVKWVYKTKLNDFGDVEKFKAWLVAKGLCTTTWCGLHGSVCSSCKDGYYMHDHCFGCTKELANLSTRCKVCFSPWRIN